MKSWLILLLLTPALHAQTLKIIAPHKQVTLTLQELKAKLKSEAVRIDDPVYGRAMTYDAFPLASVLALAGVQSEQKADEIVFTAIDGYSPNMPYANLSRLKGYLAYQEHGRKGRFPLVAQGKAKLSPGPYYVVWTKASADVPWPYQLAQIEVVDWEAKYPRVLPKGAAADSGARRGFALFKAECIRCHSINLEGGDVGPELNAPRNVTEYWRPEILREFIPNAPSFRYKSKMPAFPSLKADQVDDLIAYFTYMKQLKISSDHP